MADLFFQERVTKVVDPFVMRTQLELSSNFQGLVEGMAIKYFVAL